MHPAWLYRRKQLTFPLKSHKIYPAAFAFVTLARRARGMSPPNRTKRSAIGFLGGAFLAGILLLAAAALKWRSVYPVEPGDGVRLSWLAVSGILAEAVTGWWLMSGIGERASRVVVEKLATVAQLSSSYSRRRR